MKEFYIGFCEGDEDFERQKEYDSVLSLANYLSSTIVENSSIPVLMLELLFYFLKLQ